MGEIEINVDVLLPVRSRDKYLIEAIGSIKASRNVNTRIILVNNTGNSQDTFSDLLSASDIVIHEKTLGFAFAMNAPLRMNLDLAPYVALMNSDDLIDPFRFHKQVSLLRSNQSDICVTKMQSFSGKSRIYTPFFGSVSYLPYNNLMLLFGSYGADPTWVMTREWLVKHGERRTDIHPDLADFELALRTFPISNISAVNESLYFYRKHPKQMSKRIANYQHFKEISESLNNFCSFYGLEYAHYEDLYLLHPHRDLPFHFFSKHRLCIEKLGEEIKSKILQRTLEYSIQSTELSKMIAIRSRLLTWNTFICMGLKRSFFQFPKVG